MNLQYRGTPIELRVGSISGEADLRIASLVKGVAVQRRKLEPLWVEAELLGEASADPTGSQNVAHSLISAYRQPRASMSALFSDSGDLDASQVSKLLAAQEGWLLSMDRSLAVEIAFLSGMLGSGGEQVPQLVCPIGGGEWELK